MNNIETLLYERTISIVNCIAMNNYELLEKKGCLKRFSKKDIMFALSEYGGTISFVDKEDYNGRFDCYKCANDIYETEFDLIIDESLSDLTLICEFKVVNDVILSEVLTDIHVLQKMAIIEMRSVQCGSEVVPESLLKGKADTRVYFGVKNGKNDYVGITKDLKKRQYQHGDGFDVLKEITTEPVTRRQARAIEQVLIKDNPQFSNKINSISPNRDWYNDAISWARKWLSEHGY